MEQIKDWGKNSPYKYGGGKNDKHKHKSEDLNKKWNLRM